MLAVCDLLTAIERVAPARYAFGFDKIGLQIGDPTAKLRGIVTTLDCTSATIEYAKELEANVIVAHHPLIWDPLKTIETHKGQTKIVSDLIRSEITLIAAHTNWDCAPGGINDTLAQTLELKNVRPFGSSSDIEAYKLVTFAPPHAIDQIKKALSKAGAGNIGLYSQCSFESTGTGNFLPQPGSNPFDGEIGKINSAPEVRIEMVVPKGASTSCIRALKEAHPYEEVAFDLVTLSNGNGFPIGRIGELEVEVDAKDFVTFVDRKLATRSLFWPGRSQKIRSVAVVGGGADGEWLAALAMGADAYITGEIRHNIAVDASAAGLTMIQSGHFATENPGMGTLCNTLASTFPDLPVSWFSPHEGTAGRPL